MKKVEETIVIRNEKMIYAVRLKSKTEGEDGRKAWRTRKRSRRYL